MKLSKTDIRKMKKLMTKLEKKTFSKSDINDLKSLSSSFLFFAVGLDYINGYKLIK